MTGGKLTRGVKVNDCVPVSYTHLRAHETVLDLVCRLLLEKKKNNKPIRAQRMQLKDETIQLNNKADKT